MLQAPAFSRFRDSVTVWSDDVLFYHFYPVSDVPQVRRGADGLPVLLLVEYVLSDTERAANPQLPPGGGYLALDTTLDVPDDALSALRAELQTWVDAEWARLRAGTPAEQARQGVAGTTAPPAVEFGTPTFTKGAVHLDAPHSAVLVEARVAESVPTLLGGNVASFSLDLTPSGASLVRQSLLAPDGSAATDTEPLQVGYDLTFWARLPPASIHIAVDQRRAYDYARKQLDGRGIDHCTTYDFDQTDLTTETVTQSGAVTVQIDTGSGTMPEDVIDKLRGYALDLVKQLVAGAVFAKADPAAGGATPYVLRRDEAFQQKLHSATEMSLTVDLVQSSVVAWTVHPQGVLQTDLAGTDAATMQRLIRRVSLADGFFDHLDVTVRAFADFKPMNVSHVEVQLEYTGTGSGGVAQTKMQAFTITDGSVQRWQPGLIGDARTFRYRWRAVLDGHPAPEFGEWSSNDQPVVDIVVPEPGVVAVEVMAGNIDFDEVVAQAQVHLAYEDSAAGVPRQEETFVLTARKPSASYLRSIPAQVTRPVRYRVGWVLASGEIRAPGNWQDVPGPALLVNQPDTPLLRVSVLPAGNAWPGVQSAVVEVRYRSGSGADDVPDGNVDRRRSVPNRHLPASARRAAQLRPPPSRLLQGRAIRGNCLDRRRHRPGGGRGPDRGRLRRRGGRHPARPGGVPPDGGHPDQSGGRGHAAAADDAAVPRPVGTDLAHRRPGGRTGGVHLAGSAPPGRPGSGHPATAGRARHGGRAAALPVGHGR